MDESTDHACPKCQSSDTRKASAIYEQQTSTAHSVGVANGGSGLGIGAARSVISTSLAADLAPPKWESSNATLWLVLLGIGTTLVCLVRLQLASAAVSLAILVALPLFLKYKLFAEAGRKKVEAYKYMHDRYARTWYCLKCGEKFLDDPTTPE